MGERPPKPIGHWLKARGLKARPLVERALRLQELERAVRASLDSPLAEHCGVSHCEGETLWLHADSPVWAARLRYQAPGLLSSLKALPALASIERVEVRVRPVAAPAPPASGPRLSRETGEVIRAAAASCPHTELRQALLRLAARAKTR